jgi:hypothetical protein
MYSLRGIDWTPAELICRRVIPDALAKEPVAFRDLPATEINLADVIGLYKPELNRPHQRGHIAAYLAENVVVWPAAGGCSTRDGSLVSDSFHSAEKISTGLKQRVFRRYPMLGIDRTVSTIGHFNRNFYHRFVDSIPRIYALWHPQIRAIDDLVLLIDPRFTSDERRLISGLIPSNVRLMDIGFLRRVSPRRYCHLPFLGNDRTGYSEWFCESAGYLPDEYLAWYRDHAFRHFEVRIQTPWRKLFVSRRNARVRRILNEEEIRRSLQAQGFEVVQLEDLALADQVRLIAEAQSVVAQHGAGLTHILHMQEGTRVIEIMSSPDKYNHYSLLSANLRISHTQIFGEATGKNADITVNLDRVLEQL